MKLKLVGVLALLLGLIVGCKDKGPDLSDIPPPQPPPGYSAPAATGPNGPGAPAPAKPDSGK